MATSNLSKYQRFAIETINRRDIRKAPYNPRTMTPQAEKLLRKSLKANGLVEPLVWNRRTGNLVGGHQRIEQLDQLEKRDDYDITVSVVDVDERQEKNLNMALNNRNLQGSWDEDALSDLLRDCSQDDYDAIGVTDADLDYLLGETGGLGELSHETPERTETVEKLDRIKADRASMNKRMKEEQQGDFFCIVVFMDGDERSVFYDAFKLNKADQYIRGQDLLQAVK